MAHDPTLQGKKRSSKWRNVRAIYIKKFPICAVCGGKTKISVHHIYPFHLFPELELKMDNLITLCNYKRCHINYGHLFSYKSYNINIKADAYYFNQKIKNRL